jgi:DNA-binding Xre family transcriptional regulator
MQTRLGEFFQKHSINKAEVSRKTSISKQRLSELSNNESAKLRADELYLIALATGTNACDLLDYICGDLKIKN